MEYFLLTISRKNWGDRFEKNRRDCQLTDGLSKIFEETVSWTSQIVSKTFFSSKWIIIVLSKLKRSSVQIGMWRSLWIISLRWSLRWETVTKIWGDRQLIFSRDRQLIFREIVSWFFERPSVDFSRDCQSFSIDRRFFERPSVIKSIARSAIDRKRARIAAWSAWTAKLRNGLGRAPSRDPRLNHQVRYVALSRSWRSQQGLATWWSLQNFSDDLLKF